MNGRRWRTRSSIGQDRCEDAGSRRNRNTSTKNSFIHQSQRTNNFLPPLQKAFGLWSSQFCPHSALPIGGLGHEIFFIGNRAHYISKEMDHLTWTHERVHQGNHHAQPESVGHAAEVLKQAASHKVPRRSWGSQRTLSRSPTWHQGFMTLEFLWSFTVRSLVLLNLPMQVPSISTRCCYFTKYIKWKLSILREKTKS